MKAIIILISITLLSTQVLGDNIRMHHSKNTTDSDGSIIGGGDHDKMPHGNGSIIGGGDHDKMPHGNGSIIGGGDHDKMPHGSGFIIGGGDHDKMPHGNGSIIGGGDHDRRPHSNGSIIGGGDHDRRPHSNGSIIGGGDHDRRPHSNGTVIGGGDHDKVPHGDSTVIGGGDHDKVPHGSGSVIGGGDHDKVPHGSGSVIGGGDHDKVPHGNGSVIGGGDHDRRPHGKREKKHGDRRRNEKKPLGGDDADKVAFKIVSMTNFLNTRPIEELKQYVLKVEEWRVNEKNDVKLGGPHDFIDSMSQEKCVEYIISSGLKFPELLEEETFLSVVAPVVATSENIVLLGKVGGLSDFIFRLDKETLVAFAFTCEKYHKEQTGDHLRGGLHDRIFRMTESEIAEYILEMAAKYPELDNYSNLQKMSVDYGFSKN